MEITDFAAALRAMAGKVADQAVDSRRDADLIDELRRQLSAAHRSLDAIGRMRKQVLTMKAPDAVQILCDALLVIDGPCANYIPDSWTCRTEGVGKTRGAKYGAEAWCAQCVARDALERVGITEQNRDERP